MNESMKFEITQSEKKQFKPITVDLTIESEEELVSLMGRLDIATCTVVDSVGKYYTIPIEYNERFNELWHELKEIARQYNLFK